VFNFDFLLVSSSFDFCLDLETLLLFENDFLYQKEEDSSQEITGTFTLSLFDLKLFELVLLELLFGLLFGFEKFLFTLNLPPQLFELVLLELLFFTNGF